MERWPLERRGARILGFLFTCFAMLFLLYGYVSGVTAIFRNAVFDLFSAFAILLLVTMGLMVIAVLAYNTVYSLSRLFITSRGVERRLFGKSIGSISWDSLAETGVALRWDRSSAYRTLYFSDHPLEEAERIRIERVGFPNYLKAGIPIRTDCRYLINIGKLTELCPLPIPPTDNSQSYQDRYDLLSYRREKDEQGAWGETTAAFIATAAVDNFMKNEFERRRAAWRRKK